MSSYTTNNRLIKQVFNENVDTWGDPILNTQALDMIDESLDGKVTVATTGGIVNLTSNNGSSDEQRPRVLKLTGTLASNAIYRLAAVDKIRMVYNALVQSTFTATIGVSGGTHATLQPGWQWVQTDGTDTFRAMPTLSQLAAATASVDFGSNKGINVADGSAAQDIATYGQLVALVSSSNPGVLGVPLWRSARYR
jgi:hypothetical protein